MNKQQRYSEYSTANLNRGYMMRSKSSRKAETDRDFSGVLNVDGVDYWISGWEKAASDGRAYIRLAVRLRESS